MAFSAFAFFGKDMVAKGTFTDELAAAGDLDAFFGAFVGFEFGHRYTFPALDDN